MKLFLLLISLSFSTFATDLPYVNWENHPIHAIDISPDKTRLAVTHTADNRVQLFDISLGYPVRLGHVKVGIDPVSVRFKNENELWVVNHISDSVSVVDFNSKKVIATIQTADEPFDVVFANNKAFISCSQANQILVVDTNDIQAPATVIDIMAEDPRAMVVNNDGSKVFIASFESGNRTTILAGGINEGEGTLGFPGNPVNRDASPYQGQNPPPNDGNNFFPEMNSSLPTPPKVSLIVRQEEDGRWLDDNGQDWTHMISGDQAELSGRVVGWKLLDHDITVIDTQTHEVSYITGLMNVGMGMSFNSAMDEITLVGTDSINHIRFEPILNGVFVRAKIATVSVNDFEQKQVLDLNPHLDYLQSTLDQSDRDQSIGNPRGIVWDDSGEKGYVTGMGSNNVIIINNLGQRLGKIEVGEGATGIVIDDDKNRLYVWNHFASSLSTINTSTNQEMSQLHIFNPLPQAIKEGRKFLYSSHDTSGLGQASCASCHVDGRMDKLAWDLGDPSGELKTFNQNCQTQTSVVSNFDCDDFHPMKGPMMTQTFQDIIGNEPFHWRGDRNGIEEFNGAFKSINGDDTELTAIEMQKYKDMLATITFPPNPFRNLDNTLPDNIELSNHYTSGRFSPAGEPLGNGNPQNGLTLYNLGLLDRVFQCGSCHTLPTGMAVNGPLKLGAINAIIGGEVMPLGEFEANHLGIVSVDGSTQKSIKTPQLRNLYDKVGFEMSRSESLLGFGFLHDGAIDSVARFLSAPTFGVRSDQDVADLVALMMAFSGSELENGSIPLGNTPEESQDTHAGVGKQLTITQASQINTQMDEFIVIANSNKVQLIANSNENNYLYQADTNAFVSQTGDELTSMGLLASASPQTPITLTIVPKDLGQRLAFDRDGDGVFDFQEIINGSDLTDQNSTQIRPKAGLWYNPQRSGHGMDLQFIGDTMYIIWYTYNDDGSPTWYLASAEYATNWQADLSSFQWDFDSRTATKTNVGTVQIDFSNALSSHFSWTLNGRSSNEDFSYLKVSNSDTTKQFTGTYFNPDDSGWGMTINTQGQAQVAVIYYYDESGMPRWVLGNGDNTQDSLLEMYSYSGFCPDCEFVQTSNQLIGTVDLLINTNADRKLTFSTDLLYPDNQQSWLIENINMTPLSSEIFEPELQ